jgi:hypothetical protein
MIERQMCILEAQQKSALQDITLDIGNTVCCRRRRNIEQVQGTFGAAVFSHKQID